MQEPVIRPAPSGQAWQEAARLAAEERNWSVLRRIASGWSRAYPSSPAAWQTLSRGHFEDSQFSQAIDAFARVLELEPDNVAHLVSAARLATAAQQYEAAQTHLATAEALAPNSGEVLYALSRVYQSTGQLSRAEHYCRRAIQARPGFPPAYTNLGLLREGRLEDDEILTIQRLISHSSLHPEYRAMLSYTLGDALEHKGDYGAAFSAWESANGFSRHIAEREGIVYNAADHEAELNILDALFAEPIDAVTSSPEPGTRRPIFVLGMPRSGTTLVESILASHSDVHGGGELLTLAGIYESLIAVARREGIDAARKAMLDQAAQWRVRYLDALPPSGSAGCVVDKLPMNYRAVGLIRALFPESPVIYTHRSPMDTGLSIFRHNFSKNWPCATSLRDIGDYYAIHARIVALWQKRYPGLLHVVDHSRMVDDPKTEISRLLLLANLDPEPACFNPHGTKRSVATFSSVQVQRPISDKYSGRSAHYTSQLEPLRETLKKNGID